MEVLQWILKPDIRGPAFQVAGKISIIFISIIKNLIKSPGWWTIHFMAHQKEKWIKLPWYHPTNYICSPTYSSTLLHKSSIWWLPFLLFFWSVPVYSFPFLLCTVYSYTFLFLNTAVLLNFSAYFFSQHSGTVFSFLHISFPQHSGTVFSFLHIFFLKTVVLFSSFLHISFFLNTAVLFSFRHIFFLQIYQISFAPSQFLGSGSSSYFWIRQLFLYNPNLCCLLPV